MQKENSLQACANAASLWALLCLLLTACQDYPLPKIPTKDREIKADSVSFFSDTAPDTTCKIYLTFDDGPNKGSPFLLEILQQYQIPVSFFLVGKHVYISESRKEMLRAYRAYSKADLCNHSYTHANHKYKSFYANPQQVVADFERCQDSLKFNNRIARAPGMNMWRISGDSSMFMSKSKAAEELSLAGFQMIGWDLEWDFKRIKGHEALLQALKELEEKEYPMQRPSYHHKHLVVLLHDQSFSDSTNRTELQLFIEAVVAAPQKYKFAKISDYPPISTLLPI